MMALIAKLIELAKLGPSFAKWHVLIRAKRISRML
jgi:hypothetical protein